MASGIASVSILMQWGLVGEAIDYNELLTGKRTEGSIYGTFNLSRRIGQTVGNSAAVLAFRFVWNITPEIRAKMAASKAAKSAQ